MNEKTINNIPVSEVTWSRMILLQEKNRRIDAESRLLAIEKAEVERDVKALLAEVEASAPKPEASNGASAPAPAAVPTAS